MLCRKNNTQRAAQKMPSETTTACVRLLVFFIIRLGTFPYGVEDDASTISLTPTTHYTNTCVKLTIVTHLSFSERIATTYISYGFLKIRDLHGTLFLFGTDAYCFQEPRVQMVRCYGFHTIAVRAWMVREKLGLLRSGLRSLVKSAVWLRCGSQFQVMSAGRFRSGLLSTSLCPNCDISHAFNFRHAFTAAYKLFYISTSTVSPAAASCADCTSWRHWLRLSCCAAMTALYV